MGDDTKIQWADATFNPWIGCTKVSAGCAHCYAENTTRARVLRSRGQETWGKGAKRSRTSAATWHQQIRWDSAAQACGTHPRVFTSLCDWLDEEVPVEWFAEFLRIIHATPNLDRLLLTKRPDNFEGRMEDAIFHMCRKAYDSQVLDWVIRWKTSVTVPDNVWIGVSVENQEMADLRIPQLLEIPARLRFLSVEPMLGPVKFLQWFSFGVRAIHWVIVGGESGPKARPCNIEWICDVVQDCISAEVPCFVKQLGSNVVFDLGGLTPECKRFVAVSPEQTRAMLIHPKGGEPSEWPERLRVRQFPSVN